MPTKPLRVFLYSAGVLLALAGFAKLISSFGSDEALASSDPVLRIPFRYLFKGAGAVELAVAAVCIFSRRVDLRLNLLCSLSAIFVVYRFGLLWAGYHGPCNCLGSLTREIHIPPATADRWMKAVLAYLLIGSYGGLLFYWKSRRSAPAEGPAQS